MFPIGPLPPKAGPDYTYQLNFGGVIYSRSSISIIIIIIIIVLVVVCLNLSGFFLCVFLLFICFIGGFCGGFVRLVFLNCCFVVFVGFFFFFFSFFESLFE